MIRVRELSVFAMLMLSLQVGVVSGLAKSATAAEVEYLNSGEVLPADLPFSEAVRVGDTLYLSGQLGIRPGTLELAKGGIKPETTQTMRNILTTLESHGYNVNDLVKCTAMLADMSEWPAFNEAYRVFFADHYPARSAFGAAGLAFDARIELECIAVRQPAEKD